MEFIPSTNLKILSGVPLDNTYKDTLTFSTESGQYQYFASKVKTGFSDFTFQRTNSSIRVPTSPNALYDCNYIMFQNENFGNKWFYGFIKEINYLNQNVSEIVFELDLIQTWYFNFNVGHCFVEREHTNNDAVGANTVPEGLETGAYITTSESNLLVSDLNVYIMATDKNEQEYWNDPAIVGGFPISTYWASLGALGNFSVAVLKGILESYAEAGKVDAIVSVFTAPSNMVSTQNGVREQILNCAPLTPSYTPKNNKLLTYPYCSLSVVALGQGTELKYELFSAQPSLKVRGGFGANMQVSATPLNYEGQAENIQNTISIKDFPICAWVSNYYQNWLAQNKASIVVNTTSAIAGAVAGGVTSAATGNYVGVAGSIAGGVGAVANTAATVYQNSIIPDKMVGSANASDIFAVSGRSGFYSFCRTIRPEYAKIIDGYFTMFGYKVNTVKVPNIKGRASWNYVKTIDAVITGSIPVGAIQKIKSIFNQGVTFWHGDYVGDYTRNNNIV